MSEVRGKRRMTAQLLMTLLRSPVRTRMIMLLLIVAGLLAGETWLSVQMLSYAGNVVDALTARNSVNFYTALKGLIWAGAAAAAGYVALGYFRGRLTMDARTELVRPWLLRWLSKGASYRIEREHTLDNPDQRIAEDLKLFVDQSLDLGLGLYGVVLGIGAYTGMLWQQGGPLVLEWSGYTWTIPGYMFWAALLFAIFNTWLSRQIAKPLVGLTMRQQQVEADFRFGMIQVREHAEQVALYRGGRLEYQRLTGRFEQVRQNWWRLIFYQMRWTFVNLGLSLSGTYAVYVLVGGKVIAGILTVGAMTTLGGAFGMVLNKLNWFAMSWYQIVAWIATIERLKQMDLAVREREQSAIHVLERNIRAISVKDLSLALPDGSALTAIDNVQIEPGERWLIRGPSGVGKSTLLRAIAGLWPHGAGTVVMPAGGVMFLPQKCYLPWDTLKVTLTYPRMADAYSDEQCRRVLMDCRLPKLVDHLHERDRWGMRLSLGEQQRLAFARVLLAKPSFLFLDESTSALDVDTEQYLYKLLIYRLPKTAMISVAHRTTLDEFHDHRLLVAAETSAIVHPSPTPTKA